MQVIRKNIPRLLSIVLLSGGPLVLAQTEQKKEEQEPAVRIVTNEVRVPLRVFNALGQPVTNLMARDIVVIEDGEACPVTSLKREPANILLVLDQSNLLGAFKSGRGEPPKERVDWTGYSVLPEPLAYEFAANLSRGLGERDQLALVQYADRVELVQDWTRDRAAVLSSMRAKIRAGLKARFFDALDLAADGLQAAPPGRRVLVLLSDGVDAVSLQSKAPAFEKILATGASVYVVSWATLVVNEAQVTTKKARSGRTSQSKLGTQVSVPIWNSDGAKRKAELKRYQTQIKAASEDLQKLVAATGGEYWQPTAEAELKMRVFDLLREIGTEYTLTYLSKKDQLERQTVIPKIEIARPGLTARTRR